MLGLSLRSRETTANLRNDEPDVAKLFFDAFSKRLTGVEEGLRSLSSEIEKLKLSRDRSQISDLVLLERLQKVEEILQESLSWIKRVADTSYWRVQTQGKLTEPIGQDFNPRVPESEVSLPVPMQRLLAPSGEAGTLPSITTPTELQVLTLLADQGPMSAPEIGKVVGRSREHSARLMKRLFDEGYVRRDQTRIPFRYSLVDRVRQSFKKVESKSEGQETVTVPQA